ncbi:MAG: hypothetical protein J6P61_03530 [Erysipelotrichaceae bacterium]|nr:hypothetical protein [Erysipelotrichaceae bacterium]
MLSPWDIIRRYLFIFLAIVAVIIIIGLWMYRGYLWSFMMNSFSALLSGILVIGIILYIIVRLLLGL